MKPEPRRILEDARYLKDQRYKMRDSMLFERRQERFRKSPIDVPPAYEKTATRIHTPIIEEEGRAVMALVHSTPVPHVNPPRPEDQALTTRMEQWAMALHQEMACYYGNVSEKNTMAQVHDKVGWRFFGMHRKPYANQPKAPEEDDDIFALAEYADRNTTYKKEAGIASVFEDRHVPSDTIFWVGDHWNPKAVFEIKDVDELELIKTYNLRRNRDGQFEKIPQDAITTMPSGNPADRGNTEKTIRVIEYWDAEWCMILIENVRPTWMGARTDRTPFVLEEWEHGWGRTPYFCRPAFENEVSEPEFEFAGPLDGLYAEVPHYNQIETMKFNVMWLTGYPSWQIVTKESGELILDESGQPKKQIDFVPGKMFQGAPGQSVLPLPMDNGALLPQEAALSAQRLQQFSLSPIAKGVSPGADTANSALSNLRRLQRSALQPMADNHARQWREILKFAFERVQELGETVYVYSRESGDQVPLAPEDIVTLNVDVKVNPDTGQDALLVEKAAREAYLTGAITELEYHELRGKEAPEEFVRASALDRLRRSFEPELFEQIKAMFGQSGAIMRLIAAQQETGDAKNAIPELMNTISGLQQGETTGMGSGSGGQPRAEGVRSPYDQQTTQPMAEMGV